MYKIFILYLYRKSVIEQIKPVVVIVEKITCYVKIECLLVMISNFR